MELGPGPIQSLSRQVILLVDDDPAITEALTVVLARDGRTTIACGDVHAAEILLTRYPITHLITDVQFSGEFGFEGLHFLGRIRTLAPRCRIVLMTGHVTDPLVRAAKTLGASEVLSKPFDGAALEEALGSDPIALEGPSEAIFFPTLDEILRGKELTSAYQPILRRTAAGTEVFGYEALTRVRGNWLVGGPETLFDYGQRLNQLAELNLAALDVAIQNSAEIPGAPVVFINLDPVAFRAARLIPILKAATARSGVSPSRIVLEATERSGFTDVAEVRVVFDELRSLGLRFALDDHASAYSHLAVIDDIRPTFMKISSTFGTGFEAHATRARVVKHIVTLAHDLGCESILEGIENESTALAAEAAGVDLMQGYYFGRPKPADQWV